MDEAANQQQDDDHPMSFHRVLRSSQAIRREVAERNRQLQGINQRLDDLLSDKKPVDS